MSPLYYNHTCLNSLNAYTCICMYVQIQWGVVCVQTGCVSRPGDQDVPHPVHQDREGVPVPTSERNFSSSRPSQHSQEPCGTLQVRVDIYTYINKASHLCYIHAWHKTPTLPVTPAQLKRPGIGRNASCALCDCSTSRP